MNHSSRARWRNRHRNLSHVEPLEIRQLFSGGGRTPPSVGPEQLLPGDTTPAAAVRSQFGPSLAEGPNGVSLAVWQDTRSAGGGPGFSFGPGQGTMSDIYAARIAADGTVIDATPIPVAVNDFDQITPMAAWNGSNWLVAWQTQRQNDQFEEDINAVRVAPDGTVLDPQPVVIGTHAADPSSSDDIDPSGPLQVLGTGSDWIVTYKRFNPATFGGVGIDYFAVKVTANGTVPNQEGTLYRGTYVYNGEYGLTYSPVNGGRLLHVFGNQVPQLVIEQFDANSIAPIAGTQRMVSGADMQIIKASGSPSGWIVGNTLNSGGSFQAVQVRRVNASGNYIDTAPINVVPQQAIGDPSFDVRWDGVDYAVAFSTDFPDDPYPDNDIFLRRVDPSAPTATALRGPAVQVIGATNHQSNPSIVGSGNGSVQMLYVDQAPAKPGISVATVSPADQLVSEHNAALGAPTQGWNELATDGTNFLATFLSSDAFSSRLLVQRLSADGTAIDAQPREIANLGRGGIFQTVFLDGRYVVLYNRAGFVQARTVDPTSGAIGAEQQLMPTASGVGFVMDDASVNGDRLLILGNSNEGSPHFSIRYGRIFDSTLQPLTARFQVGGNFALSGDSTALGDGWIATWNWKPSHDFERAGVASTIIHPDGSTTGQFNIAHTYPDNFTPTVVSNGGASGTEAMVIWDQLRDPVNPEFNDGDALRGQRIALDGSPIGGRITLVDEPEIQADPRATFDGTNYVVSWTDRRNTPYPAMQRPDIFAARVAPDGAVLDPGGFPVADSFRLETISDVEANAAGRVIFAYSTFRHEKPYASYRLATRALDADAQPPQLVGNPAFLMDRDQAVSFAFDKQLANVEPADLIVRNNTTGQIIPSGQFAVRVLPAGDQPWTYQWIFTAGLLPDGNYTATLPAGSVTDLNGHGTTTDYQLNYYFLGADANRDRHVNDQDQAILTAHLGQNDPLFSHGDFNYDGTVNAADQAILDAQLELWLPARGPIDLSVAATSGHDRLRLRRESETLIDVLTGDGRAASVIYRVMSDSETAYTLNTGDGDDTVTLDLSGGVPFPTGSSLALDGGAGTDWVAVAGSSASETVSFNGRGVLIADTLASTSNVERASFNGNGGWDNLDISGGPTVTIDGPQHLQSLAIRSGGSASVRAGGAALVALRQLNVATSSTLDLNDNDLLLDYTGVSPLSSIQSLINAARSGGAWSGNGLTSQAARSATAHNTTLGAMEATDFKSIYGATAMFDGEAIDATAVLVKYTYYGDADFNGKVNFDDYVRTDNGFNNHMSGWMNGDFDGNGQVNFDDYVLIDLAFNTQGAALGRANGTGGANRAPRLS